ncbi:MAG: hypothetical protein NTX65_00785 [Ignavibacteriales bacterium]|nr:hypothetical protein [Ignavibacteriales bacterium]
MLIKRRSMIKKESAILFLSVFLLCSSTYSQECRAKVEIISNKDNALVFVDSVLIGKGNVKTELTKGSHYLRMNESSLQWGKSEINDTLIITDCTRNYLFNYEFKPENVPTINQSNFEFGKLKKVDTFFSSATFKILLGSAAVLGGIAAYYKIRADKKYDDYVISKNQSTLDEVNRLDLYSGISFGLLQINFGYLIYKFLSD